MSCIVSSTAVVARTWSRVVLMVVACVFGPLERYLFLREACCWEALLPEQPPCIVAALRCRRCLLLCCPEQLLLYCNGSSGLVSSNAIAKPCRPTSKHPSRIVPTLDSPPAAIRCIAAASRYTFPPLMSHQPSCIAAGLHCCCFHQSNLAISDESASLLDAVQSAHSPSFHSLSAPS